VYDTGGVVFMLHITKLYLYNSGDTLQNCTLELATLGDLKLVEKPQPVVLAPHDFCNIKANVKVASTENGIIFGNIGKCCVFIFLSTVGFLESVRR
jgi:vesicle coat complex subunit